MDVVNEETLSQTHVIHKTRVDFTKRMPQDVIHIVQYDKSLPILKVDLYLNGSSYTLPASASVYIRWGKMDHTFVYKEVLGKSEDGKSVYVEIDDQMTYFFGNPAPILELKIGSNSAGSSPINISIDRNPIQNGDVESHSEYPDLERAVEIAQEAAETAEEAAAQVTVLTEQVEANTTAIAGIKDGTSIDSFSDVETELALKANSADVTLALAGKQDIIDSTHMLSADLVDDTNATHKFVTANEKAQITANANAISGIKDGTNIDSFSDVESALALKADQATTYTKTESDAKYVDLTSSQTISGSKTFTNNTFWAIEDSSNRRVQINAYADYLYINYYKDSSLDNYVSKTINATNLYDKNYIVDYTNGTETRREQYSNLIVDELNFNDGDYSRLKLDNSGVYSIYKKSSSNENHQCYGGIFNYPYFTFVGTNTSAGNPYDVNGLFQLNYNGFWANIEDNNTNNYGDLRVGKNKITLEVGNEDDSTNDKELELSMANGLTLNGNTIIDTANATSELFLSNTERQDLIDEIMEVFENE